MESVKYNLSYLGFGVEREEKKWQAKNMEAAT